MVAISLTVTTTMSDLRIVEADIEPELQDAFREVLRQAPQAVDIGHLVALCFEAGVRAERDRADRGSAKGLTKAAQDVLAERQRQIQQEGWTPAHDDDEHDTGALADAASCYAREAGRFTRGLTSSFPPPAGWPWGDSDWKPTDARGNLIKAGALILAEVERRDRRAGNADVGGTS